MKFELTQEQKDIVNTVHDTDKIIKIQAFAGASKTTSLVEVVKEIRKTDKKSKILYLVFNKSMVEDSKNKFEELGLNVECYTTHSFCLRRFNMLRDDEMEVMSSINYADYMKVKNTNSKYKFCKFKNIIDMFNSYCLCFDSLEDFCKNVKINPKNYDLTMNRLTSSEIDFFKDLYQYFIKKGKYLHNMYVKEYVCNTADKVRGYKYILLDEAQDTNLMALRMLKRFVYDKMWVVGDIHQQLYRFNKAVNAMDKFEGTEYPLTTSFRFNNEVCDLANKILRLKPSFKGTIKNFHNNTKVKNKKEKAILFRTNANMFMYAVELIKNTENTKVKFMDVKNGNQADNFECVFSDMIYFFSKLLENRGKDEYLDLYKSTFKIIRSKQIDDYVKIAEKEGYNNLYRFLYQNKQILSVDFARYFTFFLQNELEIVDILSKVRNSEDCENPDKTYTLLTVHRAKGLEFENVKIAPDKWRIDSDDEINILYVAVTRAKHKLDHSAIDPLIETKEESETEDELTKL